MQRVNLLKALVAFSWALGLAVGGIFVPPARCACEGTLAITSVKIESFDVVVTVQVPAGVRKVTLESRSRLGAGTWVPRAVQRLDGSRPCTLTFRLPRGAALEVLRVRGDENEPLPTEFYQGQTSFKGQTTQGDITDAATVIYADLGTRESVPSESSSGENREVVESDIWKIQGSTLYFFNQYRGLQVIDLASPDSPKLTGTLPMPAAGEQMYVLGDGHLILLTRNCSGWGTDATSVVVIRVENGVPQVITRALVEGSIVESRLVGSVLYVASSMYKRVLVPPATGDTTKDPSEQWEWGTQVTSIDFSAPGEPVIRDRFWYAGYGSVVAATDRYFFVVSQDQSNWSQSLVHLIDITSADGVMKPLATLSPGGRVIDKFKINVSSHPEHGEVLSVICEVAATSGQQQRTILKTYSLRDATNPVELGKIEVGKGESLFATRFDNSRVYIVTYQRVDPLWIVDLSDPGRPQLSGELHVPGWSTYIHPLGDRLVTIGIDDQSSWKVAVSLFDVRDPAKPGLLDKIVLGESGSWSEANWDEKAFAVLPSAGLILVPYGEWTAQGSAMQVQLIDLGENALTKRGVIAHKMQPRRATAVGDRVFSISGKELLVVDCVDRDRPVVAAELQLSWAVDRVLIADRYLIEAEEGSEWLGSATPVIRVTDAHAPDTVLCETHLRSGQRLAGMTVRDGVLYVLQAKGNVYIAYDETSDTSVEPEPNVTLNAFSLSALPHLELISKVEVALGISRGLGNFKPIWLDSGVLVWASSGGIGPWLGEVLRIGGAPAIGIAEWWWRPRWGYGGGLLLAFDTGPVKSNGQVRFLSVVDLSDNGQNWSFSEAYEVGRCVYLSHRASYFVPRTGPKIPFADKTSLEVVAPETGFWETKDYVDVVDFTDPEHPTVRPPVEVPGQLRGVGMGGSLLYTVGYHYDDKGSTDWTEWVDALAYDGVAASLVASLQLPLEWPRPVSVAGDVVFLGRAENGSTAGTLEAWALSTEEGSRGKFVRKSVVKLENQAQEMKVYGQLLALSTGNLLSLWHVADASDLRMVGVREALPCVWVDLGNGDATLAQGLWLPLRDYGVINVPVGELH